MERRYVPFAHCPVTLEKRGTDPPVITGLAAVYYDGTPATEYALFDDLVERIAPGAFDRAMRQDDVRALYNHNPDHLLGRTKAGTLRLSADPHGLRYEITPPDTQAARDCLANLRAGNLDGSSFSFIPTRIEHERQKGGPTVRWVRDCQLFDVGPVTFPAYAASTSCARAVGDLAGERALYAEWQRSQAAVSARLAQADARARTVRLGL